MALQLFSQLPRGLHGPTELGMEGEERPLTAAAPWTGGRRRDSQAAQLIQELIALRKALLPLPERRYLAVCD